MARLLGSDNNVADSLVVLSSDEDEGSSSSKSNEYPDTSSRKVNRGIPSDFMSLIRTLRKYLEEKDDRRCNILGLMYRKASKTLTSSERFKSFTKDVKDEIEKGNNDRAQVLLLLTAVCQTLAVGEVMWSPGNPDRSKTDESSSKTAMEPETRKQCNAVKALLFNDSPPPVPKERIAKKSEDYSEDTKNKDNKEKIDKKPGRPSRQLFGNKFRNKTASKGSTEATAEDTKPIDEVDKKPGRNSKRNNNSKKSSDQVDLISLSPEHVPDPYITDLSSEANSILPVGLPSPKDQVNLENEDPSADSSNVICLGDFDVAMIDNEENEEEEEPSTTVKTSPSLSPKHESEKCSNSPSKNSGRKKKLSLMDVVSSFSKGKSPQMLLPKPKFEIEKNSSATDLVKENESSYSEEGEKSKEQKKSKEPDKSDKSDKAEGSGRSDKNDKSEMSDESDKSEQSDESDESKNANSLDKLENAGKTSSLSKEIKKTPNLEKSKKLNKLSVVTGKDNSGTSSPKHRKKKESPLTSPILSPYSRRSTFLKAIEKVKEDTKADRRPEHVEVYAPPDKASEKKASSSNGKDNSEKTKTSKKKKKNASDKKGKGSKPSSGDSSGDEVLFVSEKPGSRPSHPANQLVSPSSQIAPNMVHNRTIPCPDMPWQDVNINNPSGGSLLDMCYVYEVTPGGEAVPSSLVKNSNLQSNILSSRATSQYLPSGASGISVVTPSKTYTTKTNVNASGMSPVLSTSEGPNKSNSSCGNIVLSHTPTVKFTPQNHHTATYQTGSPTLPSKSSVIHPSIALHSGIPGLPKLARIAGKNVAVKPPVLKNTGQVTVILDSSDEGSDDDEASKEKQDKLTEKQENVSKEGMSDSEKTESSSDDFVLNKIKKRGSGKEKSMPSVMNKVNENISEASPVIATNKRDSELPESSGDDEVTFTSDACSPNKEDAKSLKAQTSTNDKLNISKEKSDPPANIKSPSESSGDEVMIISDSDTAQEKQDKEKGSDDTVHEEEDIEEPKGTPISKSKAGDGDVEDQHVSHPLHGKPAQGSGTKSSGKKSIQDIANTLKQRMEEKEEDEIKLIEPPCDNVNQTAMDTIQKETVPLYVSHMGTVSSIASGTVPNDHVSQSVMSDAQKETIALFGSSRNTVSSINLRNTGILSNMSHVASHQTTNEKPDNTVILIGDDSDEEDPANSGKTSIDKDQSAPNFKPDNSGESAHLKPSLVGNKAVCSNSSASTKSTPTSGSKTTTKPSLSKPKPTLSKPSGSKSEQIRTSSPVLKQKQSSSLSNKAVIGVKSGSGNKPPTTSSNVEKKQPKTITTTLISQSILSKPSGPSNKKLSKNASAVKKGGTEPTYVSNILSSSSKSSGSDPPSSSSILSKPSDKTNADGTNVAPPADSADSSGKESESVKVNSRKARIRHLEVLLERLEKKINRYGRQELSYKEMMSEESAYMQEAIAKEKYLYNWKLYCKLTGEDPDLVISTKKKVKVTSSPFPQMNAAVEKYINRSDIFPNLFEVKQVCAQANNKYQLELKDNDLHHCAVDIFSEVGRKLQKRREKEFRSTSGCVLTDQIKLNEDPALIDTDLKWKLKQNKKVARQRTDHVFKDFVRQQYEQTMGNDDDDSDDSDNDTIANVTAARSTASDSDTQDSDNEAQEKTSDTESQEKNSDSDTPERNTDSDAQDKNSDSDSDETDNDQPLAQLVTKKRTLPDKNVGKQVVKKKRVDKTVISLTLSSSQEIAEQSGNKLIDYQVTIDSSSPKIKNKNSETKTKSPALQITQKQPARKPSLIQSKSKHFKTKPTFKKVSPSTEISTESPSSAKPKDKLKSSNEKSSEQTVTKSSESSLASGKRKRISLANTSNKEDSKSSETDSKKQKSENVFDKPFTPKKVRPSLIPEKHVLGASEKNAEVPATYTPLSAFRKEKSKDNVAPKDKSKKKEGSINPVQPGETIVLDDD